jgi:hypothetical protein
MSERLVGDAHERGCLAEPVGFGPAASAPSNLWQIAVVVSLATFMEMLDSTIANVALPYIAGGLGVARMASWVTIYLVANAIILAASSFMAKRLTQQLVPTMGSAAGASPPVPGLRRRGAFHPAPERIAGGMARLNSASLLGRASAAHVCLRRVPICGEPESQAKTALLRLVGALVERLLGVGQAPQCRRPGGQCIGAIAQALSRIIGTLAGSASGLAPRDPLPAVVPERLLDRGPVLLLGGRQLQRGLDCRDARIGKRREVISRQLRTVRSLGWRRLLRVGESDDRQHGGAGNKCLPHGNLH